jgi:hypothetical protein
MMIPRATPSATTPACAFPSPTDDDETARLEALFAVATYAHALYPVLGPPVVRLPVRLYHWGYMRLASPDAAESVLDRLLRHFPDVTVELVAP